MEKSYLPPLMGWNSYCSANCDPSEDYILKTAQALIDKGLADCGYRYICIDDGWLLPERDDCGNIQARKNLFPHGMKYLTDKLHSIGLYAGIYLGCGKTTWHGDAGSLGFEEKDAAIIAQMGFDYLKYDYHPVPSNGRNIPNEYLKMGSALKRCGRDIIFGLCEHGRSKAQLWGREVGHSFRTGLDVRDIFSDNTDGKGSNDGIIDIIDADIAPLSGITRSGFYPDPDFLVVGMNGKTWMQGGCTIYEYRTQFALWCMVSAPLIIGCDVSFLDDDALSILKNRHLTEIDANTVYPSAVKIKSFESDKITSEYLSCGSFSGCDIWERKLTGNRMAFAFVNRLEKLNTIAFNAFGSVKRYHLYDYFNATLETPLSNGVNGMISVDLARHDTLVLTANVSETTEI